MSRSRSLLLILAVSRVALAADAKESALWKKSLIDYFLPTPPQGPLVSSGIVGPYKIVADRAYENIPELPKERMEDPTVWHRGGMYHIVVNHWPSKTTFHLTSHDGIHDWKYHGIAFRRDAGVIGYTDGTRNDWVMAERPTVYVENGHPVAFNFSVIDVSKG